MIAENNASEDFLSAQRPAPILRPDTCGDYATAFNALKWAFVFFLPLTIPGLREMPDFVAWLLILLALRRGAMGPSRWLRRISRAGLLLSVLRVLSSRLVGVPVIILSLHVCCSALALLFVWELTGLIRRISEGVSGTVGQSARTGRMLFLLYVALLYLPARALPVNEWARLAVSVFVLALSAFALCYMIALMASTARMCNAEAEGETADVRN